eukprot:2031926-Rhodomonas_salina.1
MISLLLVRFRSFFAFEPEPSMWLFPRSPVRSPPSCCPSSSSSSSSSPRPLARDRFPPPPPTPPPPPGA